MGEPAPPISLRPLGIGEIIDRALTMYVRYFAVFTGTMLIVLFVPLGIGQYLLFADQSEQLKLLAQVLQHPGTTTPPPSPFGDLPLGALIVGGCFLLVAALLGPFANNAVAVSVASIYLGRRPSVIGSLAIVFRRWAPLLGLLFAEILLVLFAYVALVILFVVLTVPLVALAAAVQSAIFTIFLILLAIAALLVTLAAAFLLLLAFTFAGYALIIEGMGIGAALGSGFQRIFNRAEVWKALVVGGVATLLAIGVASISSIGSFLFALLPGAHVLVTVWAAALSAVSASIQTVFFAIYYYDVRTRREALDLEVALARLAPVTT